MSTQIAFPHNKYIAFIQLSGTNELLHDCWAGENHRVIIIGLRKGEHETLRSLVEDLSGKGGYTELGCFGPEVGTTLKAVVQNEPARIKDFVQQLETHGIISEVEKDAAIKSLGIRTTWLHPLMSLEVEGLGAGI